VLSACETKDVLLLILSECYYEEPYAGKPHVRICEGLKLQGFSLLDYITGIDLQLWRWLIMEYTKKKNWIIAIAVAIVYLTISILFDLWFFSWIIWVAYAIYRFIVK